MKKIFDKSVYFGCLLRGNLQEAIRYVGQFPEMKALYDKFTALYEDEEYITYPIDGYLNSLLSVYQRYYREVFYLKIDAMEAETNLKERIQAFFEINAKTLTFDDMEENYIACSFERHGYQFLGGRTSGYYGPYIWKTTEQETFRVELPDGVQEYTVRFLSDFLSKGWIDYLSFGEIGTGGWSDGGGLINCVKDSYDLQSENFRVSLLKHEAQHAADLAHYPDMSPEDLEYRAKLVELIYSNERNLLDQFLMEADETQKSNGHSLAAHRICAELTHVLNVNQAILPTLPKGTIQTAARKLFHESNAIIKSKYKTTA